MELFDILKSFTNPTEWAKVKNSEKSKNLFMINRIMSIKYPLQANAFNHTKIDPAKTVDWWKRWIAGNYKTTPTFIFTSTGKKNKSVKKEIPEEVLRFICEKYEVSLRDLKHLKGFYPEEFQKYCESVKEMIS